MRRRDFLTTVAAASLLPQVTGRAAARAGGRGPGAVEARRCLILPAQVPVRQGPRDGQGLRRQVHQLQGRPPCPDRSARGHQSGPSEDRGGGLHDHGRRHHHLGEEGRDLGGERRRAGPEGLRIRQARGDAAHRRGAELRGARHRREDRRKNSTSKSPSTITAPRTSSSRRPTTSTSTSRAATSTWACASTSAIPGVPRSTRPRPSSSCTTVSTISTSRI